MKILLAALHPPGGELPFGGVQSWISTVARRLSLDGHSVTIWGPEWPMPKELFRFGIFANRAQTKYAMPLCETMAFVCHGVIDEEAPGYGGLTLYTSEEVQRRWNATGPIVRQPIDLEFWKDGDFERDRLVFYSYRAPDSFGLGNLADRLGLEFVWLKDVGPEEARENLQSAALVCASGRAALEAMACHAPTMICDWRDYNGGPLICPSMEKARAHNYSGRGGVDPEYLDIVQIARETMAFQEPLEYVEKFHDARLIVQELLDTCLR